MDYIRIASLCSYSFLTCCFLHGSSVSSTEEFLRGYAEIELVTISGFAIACHNSRFSHQATLVC
jgi:hypothetical protein